MSGSFRIESDTMGEMRVPRGSLYGAQTARAVENFPISGLRMPRAFIRALGLVKAAAARANVALGELPETLGESIARAADRVAEGEFDAEFVVDVFQTGSGTSTNMNANEVIGKLAGAHANDHVNRGQSSNDAIPSAIHIAAAETVTRTLLPAMGELGGALLAKAAAFARIVKIGRTHLQDAVPMRLGQEFSGYARQVDQARARIEAALAGLMELALGGTAVGTGLNAPTGFAGAAIAEIARRTGLPFVEAGNHFEAQGARDAAVFLSAALRNYAVALWKIANDIRLLGSGPRCGLGELRLPAVQPGSSMMPGKVNPVIAESVLMVSAQVIGHDAAIAWCAAAGNLELNVMMPLIAYDLLDSVSLLANATANFKTRLVDGLEADPERTRHYLELSLANGTALAPVIGYERAAALVEEAFLTGKTVREVALERSGLTAEQVNEMLDAERQAGSMPSA
jgi:fumarate hydratase, class II